MLQQPCIGALAVPAEEEFSESCFATLSRTRVGQEKSYAKHFRDPNLMSVAPYKKIQVLKWLCGSNPKV
jgi:hypothetical protein